jgi:hypothetical protein
MDYELINVYCAKEKWLLQGWKRDVHNEQKNRTGNVNTKVYLKLFIIFFMVKVAAVCHIQH